MREISRRTGFHFNTVNKYIDCEDWNLEIKPRKQQSSRLDPLKPIINKWLENDLKMPRKQQHTGVKIFDRLEKEYADELTVGQQTVINYVSRKKKEFNVLHYAHNMKDYNNK